MPRARRAVFLNFTDKELEIIRRRADGDHAHQGVRVTVERQREGRRSRCGAIDALGDPDGPRRSGATRYAGEHARAEEEAARHEAQGQDEPDQTGEGASLTRSPEVGCRRGCDVASPIRVEHKSGLMYRRIFISEKRTGRECKRNLDQPISGCDVPRPSSSPSEDTDRSGKVYQP